MTWLAHHVLAECAQAPQRLFALSELAARIERPAKNIGMACAALCRRELLENPEYGRYRILPSGLTLVESGKALRSGPAQGRAARISPRTLRHRVWKALGQRRKATLRDLLRLAATGAEGAAESNIRRYLRALEQAGYLQRVKRRQPGAHPTSNGHLQWVVLRWTGPRAPNYDSHYKTLYDPNTLVTQRLAIEEAAHD